MKKEERSRPNHELKRKKSVYRDDDDRCIKKNKKMISDGISRRNCEIDNRKSSSVAKKEESHDHFGAKAGSTVDSKRKSKNKTISDLRDCEIDKRNKFSVQDKKDLNTVSGEMKKKMKFERVNSKFGSNFEKCSEKSVNSSSVARTATPKKKVTSLSSGSSEAGSSVSFSSHVCAI